MTSPQGGDSLKHEPELLRSFDSLYDRFSAAVYNFSLYLTRDKNEADELFQDTWLRVARNIQKTLAMTNPKPWIITIAVNLYRDSLRKKRVRNLFSFHKPLSSETEREIHGLLEKKGGEMDASVRIDTAKAISRAVDALPSRQRQVFVLKEMDGFLLSEISEILGLPLGTVKSLMHRAVRRLRRDLSVFNPNRIQKRAYDEV
jgi:RNA polymerase sigma-70 factor (ECF subfamily)